MSEEAATLPSHARVVVIGGGNMGAAVLYHLAKAGWHDCVLLEKAELTSGATWHAAGLVSRMVGGYALGSMHDYAVDLYKSIEAETGQNVSWHNCGSLRIATSPDHLDWIQHLRDAVIARGQEVQIIDPEAVAALNPLYDVRKAQVLAALFTPDDGHVDPSGTCQAMAKGARQRGAKVIRQCRATAITLLASGEWEITTDRGAIRAEQVVNAAGYHARQVGQMVGLDLPIVSLMHHYVVTDDVPELDKMAHEIPVTRDDYFCGYIRREQKGVLIGLYDKQAPQPVWLDGCPWESESELFEPNWDGITPWLENCFERCPSLQERGLKRVVNGGITYTPDGAMLLGPAPGLKNFWLACGATVGIAWGPGAGRSLAEWMVEGSASLSTRAFDPRRFGIWADGDYAKARAIEDYTLRQAMPYPQHQRAAHRDVKQSGAHGRTATLGALYEEAGGWERPRLYAHNEPFAWRRSAVFDQVGREVAAVRERVGLGDFSAFAKFEISGFGAETFLDQVCANRIPRREGGVSLTLMLNRRGTIEGEATIARTGPETFYIITGAPSQRRVWDWLTIHCGVEMLDCAIIDKTDAIGILTLAGPQARGVLAACTSDDLSNKDFPWFRARRLTVGGIDCLALRLSFTGELAWELHADNNHLGALWDSLWHTGQTYGIAAFGSKALDCLHLEKFYRGGHELANDASHKDLDLMHLARLDKDFVGKTAMMARDPKSTIALLALEGEETDCLGGEAVLLDGKPVGSVTSSGYGYSIGKSLVIAFLRQEAFAIGAGLEVSLLGKSVAAVILQDVPYDTRNERLRA
ncbi:MAG: FAD-dependent oxidoreductase [Pseudomonadota bacterium]